MLMASSMVAGSLNVQFRASSAGATFANRRGASRIDEATWIFHP
jgi:hypothetical protein